MQDRFRKSGIALGLMVLGGVIALVGQRLIGGGEGERTRLLRELSERQDTHLQRLSSMLEERYRTDQQMAISQFVRLERFRDFAERGSDLSLVVAAGGGDALRAAASGSNRVRIPRVVVDTAFRREWSALRDELVAFEEGVDPRVYGAFQEIVAFAEQHPWPGASSLSGLAGSDWARTAFVEEWVSLNRSLVSRVDGVQEIAF